MTWMIAAFSRKSSFATAAKFFNMIDLYIYFQWEARVRTILKNFTIAVFSTERSQWFSFS